MPREEKKIIKANINTAERRGNKCNVRSVSELLLHYKSMENSSHEFQKFLSGPEAPSAQIICGTKGKYCQCNLHIPVHETKGKSP